MLTYVLTIRCGCRTIARPFDGRVTKGRALVMLIFVWAYTLPWAIMPAMEVWGRFVPGEILKLSCETLTTRMTVRGGPVGFVDISKK
jgi:r-opsin